MYCKHCGKESMNRITFAIWFGVFILSQFPFTLIFATSLLEMVLAMFFSAILLSNIIGIGVVCYICYDKIQDWWLYFSNYGQWLDIHSDVVCEGDSFFTLFMLSDISIVAFALLIIVHLIICVKRCRVIGISRWCVLVPLYNPFALLFRTTSSGKSDEKTSKPNNKLSTYESLRRLFGILSFDY